MCQPFLSFTLALTSTATDKHISFQCGPMQSVPLSDQCTWVAMTTPDPCLALVSPGVL